MFTLFGWQIAKDWVYGAAIVAILAGGALFVHHERVVGADKIKEADAKVVAAKIVHDKEVDDVVKAKVAAAVADYESLAPIPVPAAVPVLVCKQAHSSPVLQGPGTAGGGVSSGAGVPVAAAQDSAGFDPAPAVSADAQAADEEIEHLQKKIVLLQDLVRAYQDAGLVTK
jgi:hypothetical protein